MTLLPLMLCNYRKKDVWIVTSEIAVPTTVLGVYPWDLPPVSESSISSTETLPSVQSLLTLSSWEIEPGVPTLQPSIDPSELSSFLGISSTQPFTIISLTPIESGIPTIQPSIDASELSSFLGISSTQPSTIISVTPTSTNQPVTLTTSSVFSLISLIPGPTGPVNANATSTTVTAPHPSCSDKSPFTIGVSPPLFSLSLWV